MKMDKNLTVNYSTEIRVDYFDKVLEFDEYDWTTEFDAKQLITELKSLPKGRYKLTVSVNLIDD